MSLLPALQKMRSCASNLDTATVGSEPERVVVFRTLPQSERDEARRNAASVWAANRKRSGTSGVGERGAGAQRPLCRTPGHVVAVVLAMNILPLLQIRCDVRVIRKLSLLSRWRRLRPSGINRQAVASGSFIIAVYIPRIQH